MRRSSFQEENLLRELTPQVLATVMRRYSDFAAAEDAVQEALLAASVQWPTGGVPDNPRGWLIQVASRRMKDHIRAELARRRRETAAVAQSHPDDWITPAAVGEEAIHDDDTLLLLYMCCHPALTRTSAIALTLRAVGGLTTAEAPSNASRLPASPSECRLPGSARNDTMPYYMCYTLCSTKATPAA